MASQRGQHETARIDPARKTALRLSLLSGMVPRDSGYRSLVYTAGLSGLVRRLVRCLIARAPISSKSLEPQ